MTLTALGHEQRMKKTDLEENNQEGPAGVRVQEQEEATTGRQMRIRGGQREG